MKRKQKKDKPSLDERELVADQLARFQSLVSPEEFKILSGIVDQPVIPSLRINLLKRNLAFTDELSTRYGWKLSQIPFCSSGFRVITGQGLQLSETIEYKNGDYYIQEASSMLPVELFSQTDPSRMLTLDLAASPGGKTTHLVSQMNDRGLILANDSSQGRIQALRIVLQHWGAENTAVTRFPGESFGNWFPETFDRVLIDAPCSMQGLRSTESHPPRPVTERETQHLAKRQTELLTSALQAACIGGEVVYSTCTLAQEEDEGVVEVILSRFGDSVQLEDAQAHLPTPAPGISKTQSSQEMQKTIRLWPHRYDTAGFFACKFRKISSMEIKAKTPPSHSMEKAGFYELSSNEQSQFSTQFENSFGFPLQDYLQQNLRTLVRRDDKVFIFPQLLLERFRSLPVQSVGLTLCSTGPEGILPTFEWAARFAQKCKLSILTLSTDQKNLWMKGNDLPLAGHPVKETTVYFVMSEEGQFLGRGKMLQQSIKNLDYRRYQ